MQMILKENKIFQLKTFRLLRRLDKKNRKWISILRIVCLLSNSHFKKKWPRPRWPRPFILNKRSG
jgi:hypothetical protein